LNFVTLIYISPITKRALKVCEIITITAPYSSSSSSTISKNELGPYLAGLIEGDGHIYTPGPHIKKGVPYIEIAFDIKDKLLFLKIQEKLGGGYIAITPNGNSGRLIIKKQAILFNLIYLINGNMRTPKIEALHRMINWFNLKNNQNFPLLGLDNTPLKNSSWLAGFLEADASFYLNWKLNAKGMPINIIYYLRISQKQTYNRKVDPTINISNLPQMELIAALFKNKVRIIEREKATYTEKAYLVSTNTIESNIQLFDYLNKYPIFGYKYFASVNLYKIHDLALNKSYKTIEGKAALKLIEYTNSMKYNENVHTWEHLNNFYEN